MIADRDDFQKGIDAKHEKRRSEMMPLVQLLASAKPIMDSLVVDERWTRYQQTLQGLIEKWKGQRDTAKDKLGMNGMSDADLRKLNADVLSANAAISAWELALRLPAALSDGGVEAVAMVKEFEKKNESANDAKS